jgi:hypothetical protein
MKVFRASSPKVEVSGETIYAIVNGMGAFKVNALKILAKNGIEKPQPGKWYNQQAWLDAFKDVAEQLDNPTLYLIGQKITEKAKFPPNITDIHEALASIDIAYQMNHRYGTIGNYKYEKTGENSAKMFCTNPYPDEFDRGIIAAAVKKFKPNNILGIIVEIDESAPVRIIGDDSTTFIVTWC